MFILLRNKHKIFVKYYKYNFAKLLIYNSVNLYIKHNKLVYSNIKRCI